MSNHAQLTVRDIRGPYAQLLTNLQGEDGREWLNALKFLNRRVNPWPEAPVPLTLRQVAAFKYVIELMYEPRSANQSVVFSKRLAWALLDHSECLTQEVYVRLDASPELPEEVLREHLNHFGGLAHNLMSGIMELTGTGYAFSLHYGHYRADGEFDNTGQFPGQCDVGSKIPHPLDAPYRYTVWLAKGRYGAHEGKLEGIRFSLADLETINLRKPGLFDFE